MSLPDRQDPSVSLVVATPEEVHEQQVLNSDEWKGALPLEAYLRREAMLVQERLTRDGGLTPWVLVHEHGDGRTVLSSCETINKKALVAVNGEVREVVCHGVCSVFCPPDYRGKGYAGRMITDLGEKLRTWQAEESDSPFSVLWSDIGKQFYKARGWHPFPSAHISLHPSKTNISKTGLPSTRALKIADLEELCALDAQLMRQCVAQKSTSGKTTVAILPDVVTLEWHHAREGFVGKELYGKAPDIKGAVVELDSGKRVWCIWTRMWYNSDPADPKGNTLHILRLASDDQGLLDSEAKIAGPKKEEVAAAIAALLAAAQAQASEWNMGEVDIWNPSHLTITAGRMLEETVDVVHREKDSISSLRWYGAGHENPAEEVEWIGNEKYAWC
ncbi:hypothetical protein AAFC00_007093 [Neodothiora populina]|uniref:LYC1 C-terminal domain-containing protein n=1 Tax=Neodothiora populina TaxID=2781224 RepID=A0ABR3PC94_9PEZI